MPQGRALYFSRAPIPWNRDGAPAGLASQTRICAVRGATSASTPTASAHCCASPHWRRRCWRRREKLEQLRALENGLVIRVADAAEKPGPDVNTAEDLERVARLMAV